MVDKNIKVFISYSWDSEEHKMWVFKLADELSKFVHVFLDQYDLTAGKIINLYAEEKIKESDKVLIVMTPEYAMKANKRVKGAGYEYSIINTDLAKNLEIYKDKIKYIPILKSGKENESIPIYLQQFYYLDMRDDTKYDEKFTELLKVLSDKPIKTRPQISNENIIITQTNIVNSHLDIDLVDKIKTLMPDSTKHILLHDELIRLTHKTVKKLTSDIYLNTTDIPNSENFQTIITEYEKDIQEFLDVLIVLLNYSEYIKFDHIEEMFLKILYNKHNETEGYKYIWRHISDYPTLICLYAIGIICFKNRRYDDLYKILNHKVKDRYTENEFFEEKDVSLIQKINSYHLFNYISGTLLKLGKYFKEFNSTVREDDRINVLIPNNRIYNLLLPKMLNYFTNEDDFSNHFDLFEYFVGIEYMDKRLIIDHHLKFAPFGRRFFLYSGGDRYYQNSSSLVHNFIKEIRDNKSNFLSVGFFGGSIERLDNAVNEYTNFLKSILRY